MIINKNNLLAVNAASDNKVYPSLSVLHVRADRTVATDAHRLIEVSMTDQENAKDFPAIPGNNGGPAADLKPFSIGADDVKSLLKAVPKKTRTPILLNALIDVAATNANGHAVVSVTDLQTPITMSLVKVDGDFPNYELVFPKENPVITIGFNPDLLADTLKTISKITDGAGVTVELFGPDKPLLIHGENKETGQKVRALVMPMRLDK